MKIPRNIAIPLHLHDSLRTIYLRAQWSDERIANFISYTLIEIERRKSDIEVQIQLVLKDIVKESVAGLSWDLQTMTIVEVLADGAQGTKRWTIDPASTAKLQRLDHEKELCIGAAELAGLPAMAMAQETQMAMGRIKALIEENVPQCAKGDWRFDIHHMMAIEILEQPSTTKPNVSSAPIDPS